MKNEHLENTRTQMRRGVLELCILSIIAEAGEVYPPDIRDRLAPSRIDVVEGTLYPLLTRLKNAEILAYTWRESSQGPPRKYYTLTAGGHELLAGLIETWTELTAAVGRATNNNNTQQQPAES
jgi:PadR family transcriptional regulator PadR